MTPAAPSAVAPLGRQVVRNTLASYLGRAVYVIGWMIMAPWMVDRLGPDRFGLWSLISIVSGLYLTFDLGLQSALIRYVAEFRAVHDSVRLRAIIGMACTLYVAITMVWIAALVLGRDLLLDLFRVDIGLRTEAGTAIVCAGIAYGMINASMLVGAIFSGLHRMDLWSLLSAGGTLLQLAAVAITLSLGGGVVGVVLANGAALLVSTVAAVLALRRLAPEVTPSWSPWPADLWGRLLRYSLALQVINLGLLVLFQFEKLAFGRWLSLREVGEWELAYRLAFGAWSLPALLLPPLLSAVANLGAAGEWERLARLTERASRVLLLAAFPLSAGLVALAPTVVQAWLGEGHALVARATAALGLALGINILTGVGATVLRGLDKARFEAQYHAMGILLHVLLGVVLVPRLGFDGGLIAVLVSTATSSLWFVFRYHREMRTSAARFLQRTVVPFASAAIAGGVAGWGVAHGLGGDAVGASRADAVLASVLGGAALVAVNAGLLAAMRAVTREDIRELLTLVRARAAGGGAA